MILTTPPPPGLVVRVDGDGALRFAAGGKLVVAKKATLRIKNGVIVGEPGILAPRVAVSGSGPLTVGLDGTLKVAGKAVGRIVLAIDGTLTNPGEGLAGVIRTYGSTLVRSPRIASRAAVNPRAGFATAPKSTAFRVANSESPAATRRVAVAVRPRTEIDGDRILLGDVAEIEAPAALLPRLKALDLGRAPLLGSTRGISIGYVRALIRGIGVKPEEIELTVPEGSLAERRGVVVEAQSIVDAALDLPEATGYVASRPPAAMAVPPGELALKPEPMVIGATGRSVTVVATVDGKPVAKRTISLIPNPAAPSVKAGDAVRLRLVTGAASVEVTAKVKSGGRVGGSVTVVSSTGSVHTGTLISASLVEVKL